MTNTEPVPQFSQRLPLQLNCGLFRLLCKVHVVSDGPGPGDPHWGVLREVHHLVLLGLHPGPDLSSVEVILLLLELSGLFGDFHVNGTRELD